MKYNSKNYEVEAFQFTGEMMEAFKLFKDNIKKDDWPLWLQKAWSISDFYISEEGNVCISSEMDDGTIFEVFASDWILFYEEENQFFVCGDDLFRYFFNEVK